MQGVRWPAGSTERQAVRDSRRHTQRPFGRPLSWPEVGGTRENFRGALSASPPRTTLPERTDSHRTVMSGQTISPSRPRAKEGAPRTRAMTDAHGTVAPFGVRGDWEPWRRRPEGAEDSATPGGYGGKPPGVAIIGVPTGARNAGRCSDGGPEHQFGCYYETHPGASNRDTKRVQEPDVTGGVLRSVNAAGEATGNSP